MMRFLCWSLLLVLAPALAGCSTKTAKRQPPGLMSQKMASRFTKPDMTRRSIYEKSMQASFAKDKGIGSWFSGKKHATQNFAGGKPFAGTREFQTGSFAEAGKQSAMAGQGFAEQGKAPADAGKGFAAGRSRFDGQAARDGTKTFSGAGDVFETTANRDALKAQQKNVRPTFVEFEEQKRDPAYTEQQIKRLLGRE